MRRETSREALRSENKAISERNEKLIEDLLNREPLTDEQIFDRLGNDRYFTPSGTRTRRKKLEREGRVFDSGLRRKTRTGRNAIVWTTNKDLKLGDW